MKPRLLCLLVSLGTCMQVIAADRINVVNYGATPNDGSDDTNAIQRAVDENPGGSIYFPAGTYIFTGSINLPQNTAYRLYGDGPASSIIDFRPGAPYGFAGIAATQVGSKTLNVDGLTLKAGAGHCGTAIWARFDPEPSYGRDGKWYKAGNFRTATIRNVNIVGSTNDGNGAGYWGHGGIYLDTASHVLVDQVTIAGGKARTPNGLLWETGSYASGLEVTNLTVRWCKTALRTAGPVEGVYVKGFNFTSCGRQGDYAVHLTTTAGGTTHLIDGTVESVGSGVQFSNFPFAKVSKVRFVHGTGGEVEDGTMLYVNHTDSDMAYDATVSGCTFDGSGAYHVAEQNGVFLSNAHKVRIAANTFQHMQPLNGSCVVVLGDCDTIRIIENQFSDVRNAYYNVPADTYFR